jgi:hypothetical protein
MGFSMEPCRGNGLNMFFESEFVNVTTTAIQLNGNVDETLVASSTFVNVPQPLTGGTGALLLFRWMPFWPSRGMHDG